MPNDDLQLVADYAASQSEAAFTTLVERYTNSVYSAALRQVSDSHLAEEVTQAVFLILARKAGSLSSKTILTGWLYRTTHYVSRSVQKREARRHRLEQEAYMESVTQNLPANEHWEHLSPILDEAMLRLRDSERDAILLRFFENKNLREVGAALGMEERAAQKRVLRGLEKLRVFFTKRGLVLSGAAIAGIVSANSVHAAPTGLVVTVTATAAKGSVVAGSTLTLIKGALKIMAWTKAKTAIVGLGILLTVGTTTVVVEKVVSHKSSDPSWAEDPKNWALNSEVLRKLPSAFIFRPTRFPENGGMVWAGDRSVGINYQMRGLLAIAYQWGWQRMAMETPLPEGSFDYLITPPNSRETLKTELRKRFGLVAHTELREVDVLQLQTVSENHPNLKSAIGSGGSSSGPGKIQGESQPISSLIANLEGRFGKPVTDHTALSGKYDFTLLWTSTRGLTDAMERERINQALVEQLGLELVPAREEVEMLVVQKAK